MKSKAHIKGHPLHPILVSFPIAFFVGTLLFDLIGIFSRNYLMHQVAFYMQIAGVGFALLAAIPGIIDYTFTVPPNSSAKKRGARHGLLNTTVVLISVLIWFYKQNAGASTWLIMIAEIVAVALLGVAGWMGGTLVYRNQIGVDPRYAEAGKWNEEYIGEVGAKIEVAKSDELKVNQMKLIHYNKRRIVIGRTETGFVAFDDHCTHKGGSLAGGAMICGTVQCPWHGSQFDVESGAVKAGPAKEAIKTYSVSEEEGKVYLTYL